MKLKTMTAAPKPSATTTSGVTIADRFKLEPDEKPVKSVSGTGKVSATIALLAAVVGLAVAGGLVFMLYGHFTYLSSL